MFYWSFLIFISVVYFHENPYFSSDQTHSFKFVNIAAMNKLSHPTLTDYGKMVLQNLGFVSASRSSRKFKSEYQI